MEISQNALSLAKSIGLPGLVEGEAPPLNEAFCLLQLAELNKTRLLYLHACSPSTVLRGLSKKLLEDPVSRNSLPTTLKSTIQPKNINRLLEHITRKGY